MVLEVSLSEHENRLLALDDIDEQREAEKGARIQSQNLSNKLRNEIVSQNSYLAKIEEQVYTANQTSLKLLQELKGVEEER